MHCTVSVVPSYLSCQAELSQCYHVMDENAAVSSTTTTAPCTTTTVLVEAFVCNWFLCSPRPRQGSVCNKLCHLSNRDLNIENIIQ